MIAAAAEVDEAVAPLESAGMLAAVDAETAGAEIVAGLIEPQACVSSKYLYDALGSQLFEAITVLPEYYPTRTEQAILRDCAADLAAELGESVDGTGAGITLIELGAGNCEKAARLFPVLRPQRYVPIDISATFLQRAVRSLRERFPGIAVLPLALDFSAGLTLPATVRGGRRLFFYPGSSIGNFSPDGAEALLRGIRAQCAPGDGLLIGVDLVKPKDVLHAAYNDALGVTAAFNLNLLNHLNSLIGSDFRIGDWRHRAFFNRSDSRIEMHLAARRDTLVRWRGGMRRFGRGERIHTENSYKYRLADFAAMLRRAGFARLRTWTDAQAWFGVCHAAV